MASAPCAPPDSFIQQGQKHTISNFRGANLEGRNMPHMPHGSACLCRPCILENPFGFFIEFHLRTKNKYVHYTYNIHIYLIWSQFMEFLGVPISPFIIKHICKNKENNISCKSYYPIKFCICIIDLLLYRLNWRSDNKSNPLTQFLDTIPFELLKIVQDIY